MIPIELSILIPAYNEAAAIQNGKLQLVMDWLTTQSFPGEVIVIDDGSQDATASNARAAGCRVLTIPHGGKAAAIVAGIRAAQGEIMLFTDMDQATPISETPRLLERLVLAPGVAIGSRGLARQGAPLGRYLLSWSQVLARSVLIGLRLTDTQCGFKAFSRVVALQVLEHLQVYHPTRLAAVHGPSVTSGFDVEFLFVAQRLGYPVYEVPVTWNYQRTRRVRLARDAWHGIADLLHIAAADWQKKYPRSKSTYTER
jgi:dolichyl-phosphate beta-glucosyltransferase